MSKQIEIETPDGAMPAHLWLPEGGRGPGVLVLQEIFGVSAYIQRRAQALADLGYVVLAPEIFWRLGIDRIEGDDAMERAFGAVQQVDWREAVADGLLALDALRARPEIAGGVGIVGFCFGGGLGFNVAADAETPVDALVSFYGSALAGLLGVAPGDDSMNTYGADAVRAPQLHHFGLSDSFVERPVVEQIRDRLTPLDDVTFETYEGADHAFDNHDFHLHHPEASRLAWATTEEWLTTTLPV